MVFDAGEVVHKARSRLSGSAFLSSTVGNPFIATLIVMVLLFVMLLVTIRAKEEPGLIDYGKVAFYGGLATGALMLGNYYLVNSRAEQNRQQAAIRDIADVVTAPYSNRVAPRLEMQESYAPPTQSPPPPPQIAPQAPST